MPESPFPPPSVLNQPKGLVALSFRASWCGACKVVAPMIDAEAKRAPSVKLVKIDVDQDSRKADEWKIGAIPTVVFLKDGREVARITGADKAGIAKAFKKLSAE